MPPSLLLCQIARGEIVPRTHAAVGRGPRYAVYSVGGPQPENIAGVVLLAHAVTSMMTMGVGDTSLAACTQRQPSASTLSSKKHNKICHYMVGPT